MRCRFILVASHFPCIWKYQLTSPRSSLDVSSSSFSSESPPWSYYKILNKYKEFWVNYHFIAIENRKKTCRWLTLSSSVLFPPDEPTSGGTYGVNELDPSTWDESFAEGEGDPSSKSESSSISDVDPSSEDPCSEDDQDSSSAMSTNTVKQEKYSVQLQNRRH